MCYFDAVRLHRRCVSGVRAASIRHTAPSYAYQCTVSALSIYYVVLTACPGTAVSLFGFFPTSASGFPSSVSYSVALDGSATTNYASAFSPDSDPATSVLASFTNLTNGEHIVEVTMHDPNDLDDSSIILQFDRAVITSSLPAQAAKQ